MEDNEKQPEKPTIPEEEQVEKKAEEAGPAAEAEPTLEDFSKFEPEVRKRPVDYIEERKARRNAEHPVAEDRPEGGEEELSPQAQAFLNKRIAETLNPIKDFVAQDWNNREIAEVVSEKPEWSKYKPLVDKYMKADGWQGVPAKRIFQMLDYEHSGERGAEEAREKTKLANRARGGESTSSRASARGTGELTAADIAKLSPQQAADLQRRLALGEEIKT